MYGVVHVGVGARREARCTWILAFLSERVALRISNSRKCVRNFQTFSANAKAQFSIPAEIIEFLC